MQDDYAELEIGFYHQDTERYAVELRFRQPGDEAEPTSERGEASIDFIGLRQASLDREAYGKLLSKNLFTDATVRQTFDKAWTATAVASKTLRLRLYVDRLVPELHNLRWETLFDHNQEHWLLTNPHVLFSRFQRSRDWRPVRLRPKGSLRALVVIANPKNLDELKVPGLAGERKLAKVEVASEMDRIQGSLAAQEGIAPLSKDDWLVSDVNDPGRVTLGNLVAKLDEWYDILYLVCHGALISRANESTVEPYLCLEQKDGTAALVPGVELVDYLRDMTHRPQLVVLSSCQSAGQGKQSRSGDDGALAGLGPRLADVAGIPAVIAIQGNIYMETVAQLMPVFFKEICEDGQIDRALAKARSLALAQQCEDVWMPVLSMRLRQGCLWHEAGFTQDKEKPGFDRWGDLLAAISVGRCTPVLGPGLTESVFGSPREAVRRLLKSESLPTAALDQDELQQVAQYLATIQSKGYLWGAFKTYLKEAALHRHRNGLPETLQNEELDKVELDKVIAAVAGLRRMRLPEEPHRLLARLPVPVYLTANYDSLLEEELAATASGDLMLTRIPPPGSPEREKKREPVIEFCRWNEDLESLSSIYDFEKEYRPTVQRPLVYHLFGHLPVPDSLVLSEDDYFDYLMRVNRTDAQIPPAVVGAWSRNALLFLGFHFEDWRFRVLFRSILNEQRRNQGRPYHSVAVQINPDDNGVQPEAARRYLAKYFGDPNTVGIYWGSTESFLQELLNRAMPAGGGK
jgi:hypothetical protein